MGKTLLDFSEGAYLGWGCSKALREQLQAGEGSRHVLKATPLSFSLLFIEKL